MGELGTKENPFRLCGACSEKNQRAIAAFGEANPEASAEAWARFFDKNTDWQLDRQRKHCEGVIHAEQRD